MERDVTIGQYLKRGREHKNIPLEVIAQKTKINMNILSWLEQDQLDKLPNQTYVRGFVSNYAKTIGLDQNEAKEVLRQTYQAAHPETHSDTTHNQLGALQQQHQMRDDSGEMRDTFISIIQSIFSKRALISAAAIVLVVLIGKAVVGFFSQLNYESKPDTVAQPVLKPETKNILQMEGNKKFAEQVLASVNPSEKTDEKVPVIPAENTAAPTLKQDDPKQNIQPETASKLAESETPDSVELKKEAAANETQTKKIKKEAPKLVNGKLPYRRFSQAPMRTFEIAQESDDWKLLPESVSSKMLADKQNVYIVATDDDTWIAFKVDDKPIKKYVLKKGKKVFLKGDVVTLYMGNYNVAKVFYNNQLIDAKTRTGVKSFIFPAEAGKDLKLPLFPTFQGRSYTAKDYIENMAPKEI